MTIPEPERSGHVAVSGGRIWYRMNGAERGGLPLLAIHGGPGFSHDYLLPLTDLADERPVIFYDQLDAGRSERPGDPANWRIARFLAEIEALRQALGLERLAVFGNSWGGTLAAEYAAGRPPGLAALVLSSPLISTKHWVEDAIAHRRALPAEVQAVLDREEAAGTTDSQAYQDAVAQFNARHVCRADPLPPYVLRSFEQANMTCYVTMWGPSEFTVTGSLKTYDGAGSLGRIAVPTLFTCGEHDEATPAACAHFAAMVPGARLEVIADASHMAFAERRADYIAVVRRFLAAIG
ncbi:MAG: proline iminopeptidase-family hydrolase [Pseudomonadota bacterium]